VTAPSGLGLNAKELGQSLLDYIVQAYSMATDTAPLPARQVIAAGDTRLTAWDCEQLLLSLVGVDLDVPQQTPITPGRLRATSVRHVALNVQLIRCAAVPDAKGNPPKAEKITAVGLQALRDAGLLSQALFEWVTRAVSPDSPMGVLSAGVGSILPIGPQGSLVGVEGAVIITGELV
jgi:hypothetical protein